MFIILDILGLGFFVFFSLTESEIFFIGWLTDIFNQVDEKLSYDPNESGNPTMNPTIWFAFSVLESVTFALVLYKSYKGYMLCRGLLKWSPLFKTIVRDNTLYFFA